MGLFKKIKDSILFLILTNSIYIFSQQNSHYIQYMYNMNVVNPAYAGIHESINLRVFSRQQWTGLKGSPTTHTFTVQAPLGNNLGGALSFVSDKLGPVSEVNVSTDLSYSIKISQDFRLSFGIKGGYTNLSKNLQGLLTNKIEKFEDIPLNYGAYNFGFGLFYYGPKYYLGASIPYLLKGDFIHNSPNITSNQGKSYYISAGYIYEFNNGNKLKPSFMYRGVENTYESLDVSLNMFFTNGFEIGTSYRINNAMSGMINYRFGKNKSFRIGYTYEYNFSELSEFSNGTHEIMLMYDFDFKGGKFTWRGVCY